MSVINGSYVMWITSARREHQATNPLKDKSSRVKCGRLTALRACLFAQTLSRTRLENRFFSVLGNFARMSTRNISDQSLESRCHPIGGSGARQANAVIERVNGREKIEFGIDTESSDC